MNDDWLTPREVSARLKLSISTVRSMLRDGRLPYHRLRGSRLIRVHLSAVEALLIAEPPSERAQVRPPLRAVR